MEDPKVEQLKPKRHYRSNSFVECLDEFSEILPKSPKNNILILTRPAKTHRKHTYKSRTPFIVSERETVSSKVHGLEFRTKNTGRITGVFECCRTIFI